MANNNFKYLQERISVIKFGILKLPSKSISGFTQVLIETDKVDENGNLWCRTKDKIPASLLAAKEFKVNLKYIQKQEGIFIKISGIASIAEMVDLAMEKAGEKFPVNSSAKTTLLKIRVTDADLFKKKALSHYTSVLQSIFRFSLQRLPKTDKIRA